MSDPKMLDPKSFAKAGRRLLTQRARRNSPAEQQRLMVIALSLLLIALVAVLYHDRAFWFPESSEALNDPSAEQQQPSATSQPAVPGAPASNVIPKHKKSHSSAKHLVAAAVPTPEIQASSVTASGSPITATTVRTVLPPLEVEVVAGDTHSSASPANNSVHVELQSGSPPLAPAAEGASDTAAKLTDNAAERVEMSAAPPDVVSRTVRPGYPTLARQMKVQGSVILQALIGRDGQIQDLRVVDGPPILAAAAQEAVRQWRFKPHFQGAQAVETQAKITVNFTISTN